MARVRNEMKIAVERKCCRKSFANKKVLQKVLILIPIPNRVEQATILWLILGIANRATL
jgi:hypothetical protein